MNDTLKQSALAGDFPYVESTIQLAENCAAELSGLPDIYVGVHATGPRVRYVERALREAADAMKDQAEQIKGLIYAEQNWRVNIHNLAVSGQDLIKDRDKLIEALLRIKNVDVSAEMLKQIASDALRLFDNLLKGKESRVKR